MEWVTETQRAKERERDREREDNIGILMPFAELVFQPSIHFGTWAMSDDFARDKDKEVIIEDLAI